LVEINHYFKEEPQEKDKKKYKRTPKKIRLLILQSLEKVGGWIPNDPFHIRMLAAKITNESKMFIDPYTVYKYLVKSQSVVLRGNYFVLKSLYNNDEDITKMCSRGSRKKKRSRRR